MIIKRRRIAAYRFLKHSRLKASGREKHFMIDLSQIPNDFDKEEFINDWANAHKSIHLI